MRHKEFNFNKEMTLELYVEERVIFNIKRYRSKATMCRETYLYTTLFAVILGSLVPILINMTTCKIVTTIVSFIVVMIIALENVFHFRDRWKNYQIAEELLRRELYLIQTNGEPYSKLDEQSSFVLFVKNIESIIKQERDRTIQVRSSEIKKAN
jgi:hypothetical protein